MKRRLYVNWFNSPAQLMRFVCMNNIKPKNIISINRFNDRVELWHWAKRPTIYIHMKKLA